MSRASEVTGDAVARGVIWRVVEVMGTEVLAFGAFIMLARLLLPDEFGVVAQATLFILTAQLVLQQGLPEALVQKDDISEAHVDSCFWANLILGLIAALFLALLAPVLAWLLAEPALAKVLIALSPTLVLLSASRIILAKLRRAFRFQGFMVLNVAATFGGALTAITLAAAGYGVWSLVAQQWVYGLIGLITGCVVAGWTPRFRFDLGHVRELWAFSSFTVLEAMLAFCARRLDLLILALFWSAHEIGFYFLANRLLFSVGMLTYYSISHLGLPFLARLAVDPEAYREAIYRTLRLVSLACLPSLIGLALVAPLFVPLLFGDEWTNSVAPFQGLAAFSIFYALVLMGGQVLISAGFAKDAMILSAVTMVLFLASVTAAAPFGITWTAIAGGFANLIALPIYAIQLRRRFAIDLKRLAHEQMPCWLAALAMSAAVLSLSSGLAETFMPVTQLLLQIVVGACTFIGVMALLARRELMELWASIRHGDPDPSSWVPDAANSGSNDSLQPQRH
ncbi:MAG: lipopolysaccharide biosynthesis protein [Geminicoccaceae bacterium]